MKSLSLITAAMALSILAGCVTESVNPAPMVHGEAKTTVRGGSGGNGNEVATSVNDRNAATSRPAGQSPTLPPIAADAPASDKPFKSPDPNAVVNSDPCAANLQNLSGAILTYYAMHQAMPPSLSEVTKLADTDAPFDLRCPLSHLPYVYERDGLRADGKTKVIVVHDAAASHGGTRWCIMMSAPKTIANRELEVVQMPESTFRLYR